MFDALEPQVVAERRRMLQKYLDALVDAENVCEDRCVTHALCKLHRCDFVMLCLSSDVLAFLGVAGSDVKPATGQRLNASSLRDANEWLLLSQKAAAGERVRYLNNAGILLAEGGHDQDAIKAFTEARRVFQAGGVGRDLAAVVARNAGILHCLLECTTLAAENLRSSLESAHACQQPDLQVEALRCLALTAAANGDVSEATSYCEVAIQFGLQVEDKSKLAECEYTLGVLRAASGEVRPAVESIEKALVRRRELRDRIGMAEALHRLGVTYADIGYDVRATDYIEQALLLSEDSSDLRGQALSLSALGNVFLMQRDHHVAIEHFDRCLACHAKLGDIGGQAECFQSLGSLYYAIGDYQTSVRQFESALLFRQQQGDVKGETECHKCMGASLVRLGDAVGAVGSFRRCLELATQLGDDSIAVDALVSLGLAHFRAGMVCV